ncbi:hypothetical protein AB1285_16590 [Microbacterium sp. NRRL B-14842]|uniref:hypothetical protein n=1 Tax=Microbacterium sp. NRRL B-14842 TaxID=3162881 RepID=UPI003D2A5E3A
MSAIRQLLIPHESTRVVGDEGVHVGDESRHVRGVEVVPHHEGVEAVEAGPLERLLDLPAEALVRPVPEPELAAEHDVDTVHPARPEGLSEEDVGPGVLGMRPHVVVRDVEESGIEVDRPLDELHGIVEAMRSQVFHDPRASGGTVAPRGDSGLRGYVTSGMRAPSPSRGTGLRFSMFVEYNGGIPSEHRQ